MLIICYYGSYLCILYFVIWMFHFVYYNSHLNQKLFIEQLEKLREAKIITDKTLIYGTHISHEGNPYHELAEKRAITNGYHIAYDGLEIQI